MDGTGSRKTDGNTREGGWKGKWKGDRWETLDASNKRGRKRRVGKEMMVWCEERRKRREDKGGRGL